jgi:Bacterial regulatory proteins, tetR family
VRIAENGLRLFVKDGFESTTLEAVATAAGISARTLFYYFKTKEELLQYWRDNSFLTARCGSPWKSGAKMALFANSRNTYGESLIYCGWRSRPNDCADCRRLSLFRQATLTQGRDTGSR